MAIYQLVSTLVQPFFLLYALTAVAVAALWRRGLARSRLLVLTFLVLALGAACTPAACYLALGSLEWRFPPLSEVATDADAIVVLGGDLLPPDVFRREPQLGSSTLVRCIHAEMIYRRFGARPVVLCGGRMPDHPDHALADSLRDFMRAQGIPDSDLIIENRSTTTYENALEAGRLLRSRNISKIVLVTDGSHLARAERCFVAQGFSVIPAASVHRAVEFQWQVESFLPSAEGANGLARATHEWIGMLWYWINDRI